MPVDPLEEARERLEADLEAMAVFFRKLSKWKPGDPLLTSGDGVEWANTCAQAAALLRALAELDRRSPPTREGPVAWRVKDFADGWILFHSEWEARREAEGAGNLVQALYAAVPPPPEEPDQ